MKITNHNKGNYTFDDSCDGSVMYGTIKMTRKEFDNAIEFLKSRWRKSTKNTETYTRDALNHVFNWTIPNHGKDRRICLGVVATKLIFEHYKLPRYKKQNYVIDIE